MLWAALPLRIGLFGLFPALLCANESAAQLKVTAERAMTFEKARWRKVPWHVMTRLQVAVRK
jgi:hypothetical protein